MIAATVVFLAGVLVDVAFVHWALACRDRRRVAAALWAAAIQLFGTGALLFVVHDPILIVSNILGHGLGTYLGVRPNDADRRDPDVRPVHLDARKPGDGPP